MTNNIEIGPISDQFLTHKDWRLPTYHEWATEKEVYGYLLSESFPDIDYLRQPAHRMQQVPVRDTKC